MTATPAAACPIGLTLGQAMAQARALGLDRLDAQWLLGHLLRRPRSWLIAHDDAKLGVDQSHGYAELCQRRADGEPLAYLVGEWEFHGLTLGVTPDVLIPRPDTEILVDWALELLLQRGQSELRVLDLGTGSGAIAVAVAHRHRSARVTATDISDAALAVAQTNAERHGLTLNWHRGSWWHALPAHQDFDLVLSNPPYIAAGDPHLPALHNEPLLALTPGGDGLDALRQIIAGASARLAKNGWLLLEHGWDQAETVTQLLQSAGLAQIATRLDIEGRPRCTGGRQRGAD